MQLTKVSAAPGHSFTDTNVPNPRLSDSANTEPQDDKPKTAVPTTKVFSTAEDSEDDASGERLRQPKIVKSLVQNSSF